jgi:hypothetical protein
LGVKKLNIKGQSTLEFLLTLILILGFSFLVVKVTLLYAYGSFVQYAVFMSARAYYSGSYSVENQKERAQNVLFETLKKGVNNAGEDRFGPLMGQGVDGETPVGALIGEHENHFTEGNRDFSWMEGVRYVFRSKLFILPFGVSREMDIMNLTSEAWLGREVTDLECLDSLTKKYEKVELDNGC